MWARFLEIVFQPATRVPVFTLAAVSAFAVALVTLRIMVTQTLRHGYLVWNLFLAWLPLLFCLGAIHVARLRGVRNWRFGLLAAAWLLFLPNAPYIFTDLIHLSGRGRGHFWVDLTLIVLTAWTASLVGFLSLYVMQTKVSRHFGTVAGWIFVLIVSGLTGFGVYIGRFLRWNSWDVLMNPFGLAFDLINWLFKSLSDHRLLFPALFATLFFAAHVTLSALLHLRVHVISEPEHAIRKPNS
ncbi:MAG: DUF1361 domain-containing protein [Verrucomicrobia subdivision 3 bacterium]|nr:DUF1361 domain-containing protein [Limisphaerales bacterium]